MDAHRVVLENTDTRQVLWRSEPVPAPVESLLGTLRYATWEREVSAEESSGAAATHEALVSTQAVVIGMGVPPQTIDRRQPR